MLDIIIVIGVVVFIIGGIMLLIEAFKESTLWGIGCLLVNPVSIIFLILHWDVSKKPFFIQISGLSIALAGTFLRQNMY